MFRRWLPALAAVATAALLFAPAPARAQMLGFQRGLTRLPFFFPGNLPFGYNYGNYTLNQGTNPQYTLPSPSDYLPARRSNTTALTGKPHQKIEEFDPPPKKTAPGIGPATQAASAQLEVNVPAGAEVWFDGKKNTETGTVRHFETPVLQPREFNSYEVRVRWNGAGTDTDQIHHVIVQAGEKRTLNMMTRPEVATGHNKH
jgi:uncharacterized protein (TIGR03000 family)